MLPYHQVMNEYEDLFSEPSAGLYFISDLSPSLMERVIIVIELDKTIYEYLLMLVCIEQMYWLPLHKLKVVRNNLNA